MTQTISVFLHWAYVNLTQFISNIKLKYENFGLIELDLIVTQPITLPLILAE